MRLKRMTRNKDAITRNKIKLPLILEGEGGSVSHNVTLCDY